MKPRHLISISALVFALYLGSYVALSAVGKYRFDQSGKVRYGFGMAASDLKLWHPRHAWFQADFTDASGRSTTRGNVLGYFYSPLILLDRMYIHRTEEL